MFPWPRLEPWIVNDFESSADLYEALMSSACVRVGGIHCALCRATEYYYHVVGLLLCCGGHIINNLLQPIYPPSCWCGVVCVCFVRCLPYVLSDAMFRQFRGHRVIDGAFTENTPMHEDHNR